MRSEAIVITSGPVTPHHNPKRNPSRNPHSVAPALPQDKRPRKENGESAAAVAEPWRLAGR